MTDIADTAGTTRDPIGNALAAAHAELHDELNDEAKRRIKASLKRIKDAEKIVQNEKIRHAALLADLRAGLA